MASAMGKTEDRRASVFLGPLPADFLRVSATVQQQQEAADHQAAVALQQQLVGSTYVQNAVGRLSITVAQAKLVKNYGMTRMDPYVRVRVGHCVYETHTDPNGGKAPRWNKVMQCLLPQGVNSIYLEIYDECSFTMDELIAWGQVTIPQNVMNGETHEDWYPLSGKQGDGAEGMINLVLSYTNPPLQSNPYPSYTTLTTTLQVPSLNRCFRPGLVYRQNSGVVLQQPTYYNTAPAAPTPYGMYGGVPPVMMVPAYGGARTHCMPAVTVYTPPPPVMGVVPPVAPPVVTPPPVPVLTDEELKLIQEMFPNVDKEVIKSVWEANRGNKEGTINSLLQVQD